jgi:type IV pilus assembly protein PilB
MISRRAPGDGRSVEMVGNRNPERKPSIITRRRKLLGELLVEAGLITPEQLRVAMERQRHTGERIGRVLLSMGVGTEKKISETVAHQLGLPFVDLNEVVPEEQSMFALPEHLARRFQVLPISLQDGVLRLGMIDPLDVLAADDVRRLTGLEIEPVVIAPDDFQRALQQYPALDKDIEGMIKEIKVQGREDELGIDRLRELVTEAPVVRLVNSILVQAIRQNASDIHIEPQETRVRVRYRIDGTLYNMMTPPRQIHAALVSRVKIMADVDIAERRVPQDGRIPFKVDGREYDLRVSTIPSIFGEKVVMRILDKNNALVGIEHIGLLPHNLDRFDAMIRKPYGIILLTGPTGSGKSTTLYSMLSQLNSSERNIVTIEDPVEYQLPGINQMQVNVKAGVTFANGLRAFLRQDPDIIMVGEIRDAETARIAIHAALTGHLVLSTLHTNDAPASLTRLVDMGIEPFLVASSIIGVVAQRLVRMLCDRCKKMYTPPPELLRRLGIVPPDDGSRITFYSPGACEFCNNVGYKGRTGIFEIMVVNEQVQELVTRQASVSTIRQAAIAGGMKTLAEDGFAKVLIGITSAEEVLRAVHIED